DIHGIDYPEDRSDQRDKAKAGDDVLQGVDYTAQELLGLLHALDVVAGLVQARLDGIDIGLGLTIGHLDGREQEFTGINRSLGDEIVHRLGVLVVDEQRRRSPEAERRRRPAGNSGNGKLAVERLL